MSPSSGDGTDQTNRSNLGNRQPHHPATVHRPRQDSLRRGQKTEAREIGRIADQQNAVQPHHPRFVDAGLHQLGAQSPASTGGVDGDGPGARLESTDDVLEVVLDAGAEEVIDHGHVFEIRTEASEMVGARTALQAAGIDYDSADAEFVPNVKVEADADTARKVFRLIDALEDSDDVQNIFTNIDVSPEVQQQLSEDDE